MIPVNILFGEKSYLQGVKLDNEGFYRLVDESKRIPKTSQPSPHQFVEFYRKAALAFLLNVKPIAVLCDGVLNMAEKVRTRKAALERVISIARKPCWASFPFPSRRILDPARWG